MGRDPEHLSALDHRGSSHIPVGGGFFAPTPFVKEIEAAGLARLAPLEELGRERAWMSSFDVGRSFAPFEVNAGGAQPRGLCHWH